MTKIGIVGAGPGTAPIHRGTPIIGQSANVVPGRTALVFGPPPKDPAYCGEITRSGNKCRARPTATGVCVGHSKQRVANG